MTLQKSSDKSFLSMLLTKLKSAIFFPVVGLFILGIYVVALPFSAVVDFNNNGTYLYSIPEGITIDNVRYILFGTFEYGGSSYEAILMYFTVIVVSILTAIAVFKDLSNKKTANVYYSLGFSRTKLFLSTYLAGAVSVLGMVLIPFLLSFVINCFAFGFSKELIIAAVFIVSCLANVSLLAYTVSSLAMILAGMFIEGAFFSFFLNAISPIFAFASCMFSDGLLTGGGFVEANDYYYTSFSNSFDAAFLGKISFLNALSHSVNEVGRLNACLITSDTDILMGILSTENWTTPRFIPLLVWTAILAGLIALAVYTFGRKKTENIGFFASNPVLYRIFFGTLIVGFASLGCSSGRTITKGLTWLFILIFLTICLAVAALLVLILTRLSRMKFRKEFRFFGIYASAVIIFAAVFSTGFFGYQNRIPDAEKIQSISINSFTSSVSGDYYEIGEIYGDSGYGATDPITMDKFNTGYTCTISTKDGIEDIRLLHKKLISADGAKISQKYSETKVGCKFNIVYTLKNGKTISRSYYRITPELIDAYVNCSGVSDVIKTTLANNLNYMISTSADASLEYEDPSRRYFTVFSRDLISATNVDLTEEQLAALSSAYSADMESLTINEILRPTGKALGVIAFRTDYNVIGNYDEATDEYEILGLSSELEYRSLGNYDPYSGEGFVTINENMVNTVKWAKEVGIYKHFALDKETEIASVEVTHNTSSVVKLSIADNRNFNLMFIGKSYYDTDSYSRDWFNGNSVNLIGSHFVTNLTEDEINYLRENAHPYYLTTETGYFVRFTPDTSLPVHATLFVPDSKLTPEIRAKLSANSTSETETYTQVY